MFIEEQWGCPIHSSIKIEVSIPSDFYERGYCTEIEYKCPYCEYENKVHIEEKRKREGENDR